MYGTQGGSFPRKQNIVLIRLVIDEMPFSGRMDDGRQHHNNSSTAKLKLELKVHF